MATNEIVIVALAIFLGSYLIMIFERLHRAVAALLGATLMSLLLILMRVETHDGSETTFTHLITYHISWPTVFLIIGMMIIVSIAGRSGVLQFVALKLVKVTKGDPLILFFMFLVLTFIISFVLDTITTILVVAPITIEVYKALEYDYGPVLISEAIAADFSSVGSLVGSIENMIIGEQTGLTFLDFFFHLQPLAFLFLVSSFPVFYLLNRKQFQLDNRVGVEGILMIDESSVIENRRMFWTSILTILGVFIGFILGPITPLDPAIVAIAGATFLLAFSGAVPEKTFKEVEWNVIFFLVGLFILIGGLEILEVLDKAAEVIKPVIEEDPLIGIAVVLWSSAILSGVIDNIPVSATLVAILIKTETGGIYGKFLLFALIAGTNVGGNFSPIGSPANVVAISLSERE